ncbi:unnamed protein product [Candidula unifasciata]|uniref:Sigma intracellular receptor 2 n=1 Tax=Candidula unifasciata TaxID=100452 RepID=A0A8S3Z980_9EUPU|nr:unnamed protein product [Candidula unifasciata]
MTSSQHRGIDYLMFGYFLMQIPTTLLFDTQGVYPEWLYPSWLKAVRSHYLESYRDPFLADAWKHPWYLSICLVEHFFEIPFFVWATVCYYYGAKARPQIIIPSILYCSHTITVVLSIWAMALGSDFSHETALAPRNTAERLKLCSAYLPFFIVPMINLIDSIRLAWKAKSD